MDYSGYAATGRVLSGKTTVQIIDIPQIAMPLPLVCLDGQKLEDIVSVRLDEKGGVPSAYFLNNNPDFKGPLRKGRYLLHGQVEGFPFTFQQFNERCPVGGIEVIYYMGLVYDILHQAATARVYKVRASRASHILNEHRETPKDLWIVNKQFIPSLTTMAILVDIGGSYINGEYAPYTEVIHYWKTLIEGHAGKNLVPIEIQSKGVYTREPNAFCAEAMDDEDPPQPTENLTPTITDRMQKEKEARQRREQALKKWARLHAETEMPPDNESVSVSSRWKLKKRK
ncbi:MAG TPA: hypothetical protein VFF28_00745 [Candidatus Nanoarchaeia archaeon]|nr:hypothetical protein [Candidatus Nanoarchaeia archaeon]